MYYVKRTESVWTKARILEALKWENCYSDDDFEWLCSRKVSWLKSHCLRCVDTDYNCDTRKSRDLYIATFNSEKLALLRENEEKKDELIKVLMSNGWKDLGYGIYAKKQLKIEIYKFNFEFRDIQDTIFRFSHCKITDVEIDLGYEFKIKFGNALIMIDLKECCVIVRV